MAFYAPAQIVRDAREHGVEVRPVDVNTSEWDCTLERGRAGPAVRLGFRQIKGFGETEARAPAGARGKKPFRSPHDTWRRASVPVPTLERLAEADAWTSIG